MGNPESYLNTKVDFFNPFGYDVLTGRVESVIGKELVVRIEYGKHHGELVYIYVEDIIEDYGFPDEPEEKFVKWYSED